MKKKMLSLVLAAFVLLLTACGATNSDAPSKTAKPQPTATPTPTPEVSLLSIGDSAVLGDWEICLSDFYYADKINQSSYIYFSPDEGNQYAVVAVHVTNNGSAADTFLPSFHRNTDVQAKVYYADEYEYSATNLLGVSEDLHDSSMNPLTSKDGIIVFSVPDTVVNGEDSLSITFSAGRNEITFSLR